MAENATTGNATMLDGPNPFYCSSDEFFRGLFCLIHHFPHLSLTFPFSNLEPATFDLSSEYIQSLMMIVAIVLGAGFAVLVALALLLCMIISFAQPLLWPSWPYRLTVIALAIAMVIVAAFSVEGSVRMHDGLATLESSIGEFHALLENLTNASVGLGDDFMGEYIEIITNASICLGCYNETTYNETTCGVPNSFPDPQKSPWMDRHLPPPGGLLSAGDRAKSAIIHFQQTVAQGPPEVRAHSPGACNCTLHTAAPPSFFSAVHAI